MKIELIPEAVEVVLAALEVAGKCSANFDTKILSQIIINDIKSQYEKQIASDLSEKVKDLPKEKDGKETD